MAPFALALALAGCGEVDEAASAGGAGIEETTLELSSPFKIKARRVPRCLKAAYSGDPTQGGKLIGTECGTGPEYYFKTDDKRRIVTDTGHCVGIVNDTPPNNLAIQVCSDDKDQKWTFRQQVERKINAWDLRWIKFIESDHSGNFVRVPNQTAGTAATASGWSRSFWKDYDWDQEFQF